MRKNNKTLNTDKPMAYDALLGTVLNKLKCFIRMKHKPSKQGRYLDKSGNYTFKWKCERCGALLGLPHMTDEYIKKNYPIPPLPRRITDYKYK